LKNLKKKLEKANNHGSSNKNRVIMYTPVGACPHCGAPLYAPTVWMGIIPPPSIPSCMCNFNTNMQKISTTTSYS